MIDSQLPVDTDFFLQQQSRSCQVGDCGLGYYEPNYQGHCRTVKDLLMKGLPWVQDLFLTQQVLSSTSQAVYTHGLPVRPP